ncbi:imidazole glycerol phosphate synthase subunit HisH [Ferrigenium sp. UT5]|uniref:imidazole glycerol phosphate synthase subunit HisH n=1 Tax=Ferrigenium sp. UT5 TaxID=3242105 RepID=UPI00354F2BD3
MTEVAIVDYGMGNLRSVYQAVRKVAPQAAVRVTDNAQVIAAAGRVIFPGQGAMPDCMREMDARGLRQAVLDAARNKPFLGICIGLQMLFEHSAEGEVPGLGVLPGRVARFAHDLRDAQGNKLKVPHMGWNQVRRGVNPQLPQGGETLALPTSGGKLEGGGTHEHPLWSGIAQDARFYFVHSYYVQPADASLVQASSDYPQPFTCAVARDSLFAVQFHPEKSAAAGLQLLHNFIHWNPL